MNEGHRQHGIDAAHPYLQLAGELRRLGARLDGIGDELLRLQGLAGRGAVPGAAVPGAAVPGGAVPGVHPGLPSAPYPGASVPPSPAWGSPEANWWERWHAGQPAPPGSWTDPNRAVPRGAGAAGQYFPGAALASGAAPTQPVRRPGFPRSAPLAGARLLAWTGGTVTLLGVVMVLVLAASRGWIAPPVRIGAGALLGMTLIGLGWRQHRQESTRTSAVVLAATGFATLYLVLIASTVGYHYLAAGPALLLALVMAGAGLGLADHWRSQPLAIGLVVATALLAPVLSHGWLLVALLLVLQIAALPVLLRRCWPGLMLLSAAGPVLTGVAQSNAGAAGITVAFGVLGVGLGTAVLGSVRTAHRLPKGPVAGLVGVAVLPVSAVGGLLGGWPGAAVCAVAVAALTVLVVLADRLRIDPVVRLVAAVAAALMLLEATLHAADGAGEPAALLGQAVLAAAVAVRLRSRFAMCVALGFGTLGVLRAAAVDAPLSALVQFEPRPPAELLTAAGVAALVVVLAVTLLVAAGRLSWATPDRRTAAVWVPIGLVGLYGSAALTVSVALLLAPGRPGFTAGHALVTVSWTVLALVLLAHGIRRRALRVSGLVLVGAVVAKLLLFDLVALDGLTRAAAFLGAGLVLLAAGSRYARMVAEANAEPVVHNCTR